MGGITAGSALRLGRFVWTGSEYGVGRLVSFEARTAVVSFFHSLSEQEARTFPSSQLLPWTVPAQTRVYSHSREGGWVMGRVTGQPIALLPPVYPIRLASGENVELDETAFEIRSLLPKADPTDALAHGGIETQFLHDRRAALMRALIDARASVRGLTGLISSSVDLVPHQVEVVRHVLEDPIQRYLLADEVGMGKTIEAGVIVRQALIDNPDERVLVLAPAALVRQWTSELADRFHVAEFAGLVDVRVTDDLPEPGEFETLVLDEAHQVILANPPGSTGYERLAQLAHATRRLLLLSATPVLGEGLLTLALLHLLDPEAHPLSDVEGFQAKANQRQKYGRILLGLQASAPPFILRSLAAQLRAALPGDDRVLELVSAIDNAEASRDDMVDAVRRLRRHVAETYRIHQRILRSRRKDSPGWQVGRQGTLTLDAASDEVTARAVDALENWRYASLRGATDVSSESKLADRYVGLFEALGRGIAEFRGEVARQLRLVTPDTVSFQDDATLLQALLEGTTEDPRGEEYLAFLDPVVRLSVGRLGKPGGGRKVVAFTSSTEIANALSERLLAEPNQQSVFCVTRAHTSQEVENAVEQFRNAERSSVLICDRAGEEGLNLHFAHGIVHLDLPVALARIEQRVGRLDRYGRVEPQLAQRVVVPSDDEGSPWVAWHELLRDGVSVFSSSISDVQFLLDDLDSRVKLELYREGFGGLQRLVPLVRQWLSEERQRLDEQYALDRLAADAEEALLVFDAIQVFDAGDSSIRPSLEDYMYSALQLRRRQVLAHEKGFKLNWEEGAHGPQTLVPARPWRGFFDEALTQRLTFDRDAAVCTPELRLVRPGSALVSNVESFLRWDDRGTAFITWRHAPAACLEGAEEWMGFALSFVVEANAAELGAAWGGVDDAHVAALRRRADSFSPPLFRTLYVGLDLRELPEGSLLDVLRRPYTKKPDEAGHRDYNLDSNLDALYERIDADSFAKLCGRIRNAAEGILRESDDYLRRLASGNRRVSEEGAVRNEYLERRMAALHREGRDDPQTKLDILGNRSIEASVLNPSVRLDAIGFVIVSVEPPPKMGPWREIR